MPGLLIGALSFGHLPTVFVPAGPMPSGLSNKEKASVREQYADGKVDRSALLAAESGAYHSPGTCTFYGTANSNQMMMEFMGLQLPGSSFVNPDDPMRPMLTAAAVERALDICQLTEHYIPLCEVVSEKSVVNAMIGLLTTGGSTNHTIHLVAMAAAAGIQINWSDFSTLSEVIPLLAQVYPNGQADVNHFHQAGGLGFIIGELLEAGLLHDDVVTILGRGMQNYAAEPHVTDGQLKWQPSPKTPGDYTVVRKVTDPFQAEGGLKLVQGDVGRAIVKVSAVEESRRKIQAPARVFASQEAFVTAFEAGELARDFVAVLPGQGPSSNGMPELHKLTPYLGTLQNQGYSVALLTDGRMSGASGKVLAAIQLTPEAATGGWIGRIHDEDLITIDAVEGTVEVAADLSTRSDQSYIQETAGTGREMFSVFRSAVTGAEQGATIFGGR